MRDLPLSRNISTTKAFAAIGLLILGISPILAGSLTPPGPPAPTMKPLDQVEPRTPISSLPFAISAGGSYYLTKSLTATSGNGITITAGPTTIDLNGFTLDGGSVGNYGVFLQGSGAGSLTVKNGFVTRWVTGIFATVNGLHRLEDVTVDSCSGVGAQLFVATVTNSKFTFNGSDGVGSGGVVEIRDSLAANNGSVGMNFSGPHVIIDRCTSDYNTVGGVRIGRSGIIRNSVVSENYGYGIFVADHSYVSENQVHGNFGDGILANYLGENRIEGNNIVSNMGYGINSSTGGNFIIRNSAHGNMLGNFNITGASNVAPIETGTITNAASNVNY